jgi:hypothetical protein
MENHIYALALYIIEYNYIKTHRTLATLYPRNRLWHQVLLIIFGLPRK